MNLLLADITSWARKSSTKNVLRAIGILLLAADLLVNCVTLIFGNLNRVRFGDLNANLKSAECFKVDGLLVFESFEVRGDCGSYIYGRYYLHFLNILRFDTSDRLWLGISQTALVIIALLIVFQKVKDFGRLEISILILTFFSPPMLLLIERANLDGLVLLILMLSTLCLNNSRYFVAWLLLAITAVFKFYTFPLMILSILTIKNRFHALIASSFSLVILWIILKDIRLAKDNIPSSVFITFGLDSIPRWINIYLDHQSLLRFELSRFVGTALMLVVMATLVKYFWGMIQWNEEIQKEQSRFIVFLFLSMCTVYFSCYFTGLSFDYRLPFLGFALISLMSLLNFSPRIRSCLILSTFVCFWGGSQLFLNDSEFQGLNVIIQSISDVVLFVVSAFLLSAFFKIVLENGVGIRKWN